MYCEFYRMRERPFNVTADPKFLYLNARYREALASLQYGITQRKGFITLIGEAGTGKTTLLNKLLGDLDATTRTVFIFNTNVTFDEILEYVFGEFDLPVHNGKRLYMLQRLNAFLLDELRSGRNVALLIDEAQDLDYSVLEDLRLLSNLETAKEKILQIVLSGQPELGQKLGNPGLRQLRQRVAVNCRLLPLSREELTEYIQSRLNAAGCADPKLFSRDAEERIFEISGGIPRLVNVVCDNALVIGYALSKKRIGADVVNEAAADLLSTEARELAAEVEDGPLPVTPNVTPRTRSMSQFGVVAMVVVAIVIGLLSVGRSLLRRGYEQVERVTSRAPLEVIQPGTQMEGRDAVALKPVVRPFPQEPERAPAPRVAVPLQDPPRAFSDPAPMVRRGAESAPPASARREGSASIVVPQIADRVGDPQQNAGRLDDNRAGARDSAADVESHKPAAIEPATGAAHIAMEAPKEETADPPVAAAAVEPPPFEPVPISEAREPEIDEGETFKAAAEEELPIVNEPELLAAVAPQAVPEDAAPMPAVSEDLGPAPAVTRQASIQEDAPEETFVSPPSVAEKGSMRIALTKFKQVRVRPGDSVSEIAVRTYGQASPTILDLMKMANPAIRDIDVISVGQELRLPQLDEGLVLLQEGSGSFSLLLLSTSAQQRAKSIAAALREHGFAARVGRAGFGGGRTVWRVLVGNLEGREAAQEAGRRLQQLFREDQQIAAMAR